jgi:hypothetical protein
MCFVLCAVVVAVSNLGVKADMAIVHGCGSPLHMGDSCGCVVVGFNVTFAVPASDVDGFVLVAIREVE